MAQERIVQTNLYAVLVDIVYLLQSNPSARQIMLA